MELKREKKGGETPVAGQTMQPYSTQDFYKLNTRRHAFRNGLFTVYQFYGPVGVISSTKTLPINGSSGDAMTSSPVTFM